MTVMTKRFINLCVSSAAAAVLIAPTLSAVNVPAMPVAYAQAQTCSETHRTVGSGALEWGVKKSFRSYVTGPIGAGKISAGGGAKTVGGGFSFPAVKSAGGSGKQGTVKFKGEVRFYAHLGLLDITLSNLKLRINGSSAQLSGDYKSNKFLGMNATNKGAVQTGTDVTFATVKLNKQANFDSNSLDLSGVVTLTSSGVPVFGGFYDAGERFDNLAGKVQLVEACGKKPSDSGASNSGQSTNATNSGNKGGLLGIINDALSDLSSGSSSLTNKAETRGEAPRGNSVAQGPQAGTGAHTATGSQKDQTVATDGAQTASVNAQGPSASTVAPTDTSAGVVTGQTCTDLTSRNVESAQALWGVRSSFRNYLQSSIANGGWNVQNVGYDGGQFQFAGTSGAVSVQDRSGTINFGGAIQFYGHEGVLDTRMSDLQIQFSGNSGQLIANVRANDTEGNTRDMGRVTLANLSMSSLNVAESSVSGSASATLTAEGADAFGGFYPAGDPLDDLSFSAALSSEVECGSPVSLAAASANSTGTSGFSGSTESSATSDSSRSSENKASDLGSDLDNFDENPSGKSEQEDKFRINSASSASKDSFFDLNAALTALIVIAAFALGMFTRTMLAKKAGE